ncbi:hypothetical protein NDU88_004327 [Pleurodeles waltl]|uniref:Uncharacterized protein n=1 Tax=Pleurodeles waltl TaxID=8319 RepID=A0AAV7SIK5_PLEWA|nr:hypothetical protein NDU88_004327 [Pleurodeles waltl]
MAYYAGEDDYYQDHPDTMDDHMEERLVEALGYHVQDSVNQALINALKPFAQPLRRFGQRELRGCPLFDAGSQPDQLSVLGSSQGALKRPLSSADIVANMAASVMQDHGYDVYSSLDTSDTGRKASFRPEGLSSSSPSSGLDQDHEDPKPMGKRKHKSHNTEERSSSLRNLSFDPESIIHPRSSEWLPCEEVAQYVQDHIRKGFDRDVQNTLRSECPRPSLLGKVAENPDLDPNMVMFMRKFSKDPKKGLDHAWKNCQDRLLDISGPITKILELAEVVTKECLHVVIQEGLRKWTKRTSRVNPANVDRDVLKSSRAPDFQNLIRSSRKSSPTLLHRNRLV